VRGYVEPQYLRILAAEAAPLGDAGPFRMRRDPLTLRPAAVAPSTVSVWGNEAAAINISADRGAAKRRLVAAGSVLLVHGVCLALMLVLRNTVLEETPPIAVEVLWVEPAASAPPAEALATAELTRSPPEPPAAEPARPVAAPPESPPPEPPVAAAEAPSVVPPPAPESIVAAAPEVVEIQPAPQPAPAPEPIIAPAPEVAEIQPAPQPAPVEPIILPKPKPAPPPIAAAAAREPSPRTTAAHQPEGVAPVQEARLEPSAPASLPPPTVTVVPPSPIGGSMAKPAYPPEAMRRRLQGTVLLHIDVAASGVPTAAVVVRSSGYPLLDDAAVAGVLKWRFNPASRGGQAVASAIDHAVEFRLVD
jgi:protein TonB